MRLARFAAFRLMIRSDELPPFVYDVRERFGASWKGGAPPLRSVSRRSARALFAALTAARVGCIASCAARSENPAKDLKRRTGLYFPSACSTYSLYSQQCVP